ncbi:MAG: DUF4249 domain-containing protein [Bacteroidota bacterium]
MKRLLMKYALHGFLLSGLLLCFACEETVDLGIEEEESRLVVISNFHPDSLFKVVVSKSRSALSIDEIVYLDNAAVGIFEGDEILENLRAGRDPLTNYPVYRSAFLKPEIGRQYRIEVKALGLNDASATNEIPEPVALNNFKIEDITWRFNNQSRNQIQFFFDLTVEFEDEPMVENYYHLNFFYERIEYEVLRPGDTLFNQTGIPVPVILTETENDFPFLLHYSKGALIDDVNQDGARLRYTFRAQTFPISILNQQFDRIYAELRSTSLDYYNYHTSLTRQSQQTDPVFSEPVILYNNIENGYGIFAGYSVALDSFFVTR